MGWIGFDGYYCPVCDVTITTGPWDHWVLCGVVNDVFKGTCLCGFEVLSSSDEMIEHWNAVPHDWVRLMTEHALRNM